MGSHDGRRTGRKMDLLINNSHVSVLRSRLRCLLLILFIFLPDAVFASNCEVSSALPNNQRQIGSGTATAAYDGVTAVKGDQRTYIKLTNRNVLGVSYTVTIAQDTLPPNVICTY
jgi:hypothetical protein